MRDPFDYSLPSVFVVCSPFQALCAIACIRNLAITDYVFLALVSSDGRRGQMHEILDRSNIRYKTLIMNKTSLLLGMLKAMLGVSGEYNRVFIGDFSAGILLCMGMPYLKNGAHVVYLDDGSAVISLFNDTFEMWGDRRKNAVYNEMARRRKFKVLKNFFSIYDDIPNPKYKIRKNDLSSVLYVKNPGRSRKGVIFIGTNMKSYCRQLEVSESIFYNQLEKTFKLIKDRYPHEYVTFIPHGRDDGLVSQGICQQYEIEFKPINTIVEDYIFELENEPLAIYAFSSTALLNIRRAMPKVEIVNILFYSNEKGSSLGKYKSINNYYKSHGIDCVETIV